MYFFTKKVRQKKIISYYKKSTLQKSALINKY